MGAKATITREQQNPLSRDLLERELRNIRPIARMLDSDAAHIPICVQVKQGVFVQIPAFTHRGGFELDTENQENQNQENQGRKPGSENQGPGKPGTGKPGSGLDMMGKPGKPGSGLKTRVRSRYDEAKIRSDAMLTSLV